MTEDDKRARNRFGKLDAPQWAAVALVAAGLGCYFWGPNFVSRNWRTPDE